MIGGGPKLRVPLGFYSLNPQPKTLNRFPSLNPFFPFVPRICFTLHDPRISIVPCAMHILIVSTTTGGSSLWSPCS